MQTAEIGDPVNQENQPQLMVVQKAENGVATAALVVGVVALVLSFVPIIGLVSLPLGLVAVGLGILGWVWAGAKGGLGRAIGGVVCGGVALLVAALWVAAIGG